MYSLLTQLTNYYFTVNADDLDETLARFAPFFISPLFKENSLSREMRAVDSEHTKNLLDDGWRFRQVRKSLAKPESAYHKFGTGTLETLNQTDIRDRLLAFHTRYYSANVMKLVMYGRESISELMLLAAKHFEKVPNNEVQKPEFDVWPFEPSPRNLVKMRPSTGQRSLTMAWPLLPIQTLYASDPAGILTYLLGHESEGSVLFLLKEKGQACVILYLLCALCYLLYALYGLLPSPLSLSYLEVCQLCNDDDRLGHGAFVRHHNGHGILRTPRGYHRAH
jgi:insulysin